MKPRILVIGSQPRALYEAWSRKAYLIINKPKSVKYDLRHPGNQGSMWSRLYWELFFRGDVLTEQPRGIELSEDGSVLVTTQYGKSKLGFVPEKVLISCIENVTFPENTVDSCHELFEVLDFFDVNKGATHKEWLIDTGEPFVGSVQFYLSDRVDGNTEKKDLFATSFLSEEQLQNFEYSDTMVKFKLLDILQKTLPNIKEVKVKHTWRSVQRVQSFSIKESTFMKKICDPPLLRGEEIESIM